MTVTAASLRHNRLEMSELSLDRRMEIEVLEAAAGDHAAFGRIVGQCSNMVSAIAVAIVRDFPASEDISQDVFLHAWVNLKELRNPASFLPWIRQITRNRARTWIRDHARKRVVNERAEELFAATADGTWDQPTTMIAEEERRVLVEVIDELPDEAREVVSLYYREERSAKQVAELLGIREEAVRQRLSRARSRLRVQLLERFGDALARTAPGAAFTTTILAGLTVAAPSASAATAAAVATSTSTSVVVKVALLVASAFPGALGGLLAVFFGVRKEYLQSIDHRERRELMVFGVVASICVLSAVTGFTASGVYASGLIALVTNALFTVGMLLLYLVWLPRLTARRRAARLETEPGAAERHALAKRRARSGFLLGMTLSWITVFVAVWIVGL